MSEFKKTIYKDLLSVCLASRENYCVHEKIKHNHKKLSEINAFCKEEKKKCPFYKLKHMEALARGIRSFRQGHEDGYVMDVEDLVTVGIGHRLCPYFLSQSIAHHSANVIFTPYNYLLEQLGGISIENAIVIFDEGHNIESACEEAGSGSVTSFALKNLAAGLDQIVEYIEEGNLVAPEGVDVPTMKQLIDMCQKMFKAFDDILKKAVKNSYNKYSNDPVTSNISMMEFSKIIFTNLQLTPGVSCEYAGLIEKLFELMRSVQLDLLKHKGGRKAFSSAMESVGDFFSRIFNDESKSLSPEDFNRFLQINFRVAISQFKPSEPVGGVRNRRRSTGNLSDWVLNFYCMNPGVIINRLTKKGVRSIIITSGTLAPMDSFEAEMGIKFPRILSNLHVIDESQLVVFMISKHDEQILDGTFKNESSAYFNAVGRAVERYIAKIPAGVLLFFKSYSAKTRCFDEWQKSGLLTNILVFKEIFHEPQDKEEFADALARYKQTIDHGQGGIFAAVYRGKVSEGLDLANDYCRGAIIIGLPYPYLKDPKVDLKRDYLTKSKTSLTSEKWYENQMLRAVNQAVGRIVRHKDDYGIVLLLDTKYEKYKKQGLSKWLHKFVRDTRECKSVRFDSFFLENSERQKCLSHHLPLLADGAIEEQLNQHYNDHEPISKENCLQLQSPVKSEMTTADTCKTNNNGYTNNCNNSTNAMVKTTEATTGAKSTCPCKSSASFSTSSTTSTTITTCTSTVKEESQEEEEFSVDSNFDEEPGPSDLQQKQKQKQEKEKEQQHQPSNKNMRLQQNQTQPLQLEQTETCKSPEQVPSQKSDYEFDDSLDNIFDDIHINTLNGTFHFVFNAKELEENFNQVSIEYQKKDWNLLHNAISNYQNGGGLDNLVHLFKQTFGRHGHEQLKQVVYNLARYIPFSSEEDANNFKVKCVGDG